MDLPRCSVTDLIRRADEVLGRVRFKRETLAITRRGRVIAVLSPAPAQVLTEDPAVASVGRCEKTL